jgi:hypothetical protein
VPTTGATEVIVDYYSRPGTFQAMPEEYQAHAIWRMDVADITVQKYIDDPTFGLIDPSDIAAPTPLLSSGNSPLSACSVVDLLSGWMSNVRLHRFSNGGHMTLLTHADQVDDVIKNHVATRAVLPSKHHTCAT